MPSTAEDDSRSEEWAYLDEGKILDELTRCCVINPARLYYDPPFSELAPTSPDGLFSVAEGENINQLLNLTIPRAITVQA